MVLGNFYHQKNIIYKIVMADKLFFIFYFFRPIAYFYLKKSENVEILKALYGKHEISNILLFDTTSVYNVFFPYLNYNHRVLLS